MSLLNGSRLTLGESTSIVIDESIVAADQHHKSLIRLVVGRLRAVVETPWRRLTGFQDSYPKRNRSISRY